MSASSLRQFKKIVALGSVNSFQITFLEVKNLQVNN